MHTGQVLVMTVVMMSVCSAPGRKKFNCQSEDLVFGNLTCRRNFCKVCHNVDVWSSENIPASGKDCSVNIIPSRKKVEGIIASIALIM